MIKIAAGNFTVPHALHLKKFMPEMQKLLQERLIIKKLIFMKVR